jgi:hypothetical protein
VQARRQHGRSNTDARTAATDALAKKFAAIKLDELRKIQKSFGAELTDFLATMPESMFQAAQQAGAKACHQLPSEAEAQAALAAFDAAVAAAEAAQEQLMHDSSSSGGSSSSSPLAQLLAADPQLFKVAEAYSELQWLHHMAIQQKLQQYGNTAATLPGFAYACAAEARSKESTKRPGDQIKLQELYVVSGRGVKERLEQLQHMLGDALPATDRGIGNSSSPLELLGRDLVEMLASGVTAEPAVDDTEQQQEQQLLSDLRLLVLPDLGTLLLQSFNPAAAAAAADQLPTKARQPVQSAPAEQHRCNESAAGISEQLVVLLLQQGLVPPAPGSTPQPIQQSLDSFVAALGSMR